MRKFIILSIITLLIVGNKAYSQFAPLDTTTHKWFTVDNTPNLRGTDTNWEVDRDSTDGYYEKEPSQGQPGPGWFTNRGAANVGPDHRRTPYSAGSPSGAWAK